ncbi:MAG: hypothetical protein COV10_02850 [Candidatus Vogelbacteria bacterium CG10_big_fil_rev_8_21_14_0_10_51_16]|uniref:Uncharacterized protein n=1 Tax=Candidatus Vogelbacteria bacterium CG10_big_fil_rev_8_21_14_0_10_51_16 TaxID=1975045 RepID=A0A2H0RE99_9BACT|nr:MAG: hypothetical protein COV10_02850 [Candidatus Vogelbacteria bacterium CG10_big_fil_rev_8_21_14_0_10_51_16]
MSGDNTDVVVRGREVLRKLKNIGSYVSCLDNQTARRDEVESRRAEIRALIIEAEQNPTITSEELADVRVPLIAYILV